MPSPPPTLGTRLRLLVELLDDGVAAAHDYASIDYRPRFTPVMRALAAGQALGIGEIAQATALTQPAATQTVALMARAGLVRVGADRDDARRRVVHLSPAGERLLPRLQAAWDATQRAVDALDAELAHPLSAAVHEALAALDRKPFAQRIAEAAAPVAGTTKPRPPARRAPRGR